MLPGMSAGDAGDAGSKGPRSVTNRSPWIWRKNCTEAGVPGWTRRIDDHELVSQARRRTSSPNVKTYSTLNSALATSGVRIQQSSLTKKNRSTDLADSLAYFRRMKGPIQGNPPELAFSIYPELISYKARTSLIETTLPVHCAFGQSPSQFSVFATVPSLCALHLRSVTIPAIIRLAP